jgi:hypothetical protein
MSKESRLDYLGLPNLFGAELTEALHRKMEQVEADEKMSPVEKTLKLAAIDLELNREKSRTDAMKP